MTTNAVDYAASHAGLAALQATTMVVAQRFLAFSICLDYLSNGQGHRQSRRVVADRFAHQLRQQALPTAAASLRRPARVPDTDLHKQFDSELRYLSEVAARPRLTSREEYSLVIRMKAGDTQAHDALIEANLGLVVMFARRYQRPNVPMLDLVAEGNFGLLTAAKRFDPELGYRFATYAKWWVMRAIQMAIPKLVGVVRLPASHHVKSEGRPAAFSTDKHAALSPTSFTEVDAEPGAVHRDTSEALTDANAVLSSEYVGAVSDAWSNYCSETSDQEVLDAIAIPLEEEPPHAMMAAQKAMALQRALDDLSDRDRIVISKRFALHGDQEQACTLDELARELGVSKERIRQIECAALAKLQRFLSQSGVQGCD
jgi:RNA polymerase nonessential primary-like sigma factor